MNLLIKGARVVDFQNDFIGDVYIKDGKISEIGLNIDKQCPYIDGSGLTLLPSFIDLHAHFREPGFEYKEDIESGSKAAVKGGYTAVNLMANTSPVCSSMDIIDYVECKAKKIGLVDVHQSASITRNFNGQDISHIDSLADSVRIISEDGRDVMDSGVMLNAMLKAKEKGIRVMCHSENHSLTCIDTKLAEDTMTWRNVMLAGYTGCKVHIAHVSTKDSLNYIIEGKRKGYNLTCEVTPHHLSLDETSDYSVNPPLRSSEDVDFIINSVKNGYVDAISTDHAPHTISDKNNKVPGISGIETAFSVCYTKLVKSGTITLGKLSELMSKKPAQILGFNKGIIAPGYDADMVLIDTSEKFKVDAASFESKGKNTPFDGMELYGKVHITIKGGRLVYVSDANNIEGVVKSDNGQII